MSWSGFGRPPAPLRGSPGGRGTAASRPVSRQRGGVGEKVQQPGGSELAPCAPPRLRPRGEEARKVECKVSLSAFSSEQPQPAVGYNAELQFVGVRSERG